MRIEIIDKRTIFRDKRFWKIMRNSEEEYKECYLLGLLIQKGVENDKFRSSDNVKNRIFSIINQILTGSLWSGKLPQKKVTNGVTITASETSDLVVLLLIRYLFFNYLYPL